MAFLPPGPVSYAVVFIPLEKCPDALPFYLWVKRLRDLEREKDYLWSGLEVLKQARLWYRTRLEENRARRGSSPDGAWFCQLRSRIQRVNGSLGRVMSEPNVTSRRTPSLPDAIADSDLRWQNTVLAQEVSEKNRQISVLEYEKAALLRHLEELQTS